MITGLLVVLVLIGLLLYLVPLDPGIRDLIVKIVVVVAVVIVAFWLLGLFGVAVPRVSLP